MTVKDLKDLLDMKYIEDDMNIDIVGRHSGSFGGVVGSGVRLVSEIDCAELQLFIEA
jgi:hypothetical protein